ncbi:hypothetical protein [Streptomyces sp. MN13]
MTGRTRSPLDRVRTWLGIAQLALQQVHDDRNADDVDTRELAAILRELQEDIDAPGGLFPMLAQLVSTTARRAEQVYPDRDGDASCPLHEAGADDVLGHAPVVRPRALALQADR